MGCKEIQGFDRNSEKGNTVGETEPSEMFFFWGGDVYGYYNGNPAVKLQTTTQLQT